MFSIFSFLFRVVWNHCQHIGNLLQALLQGLADHAFDEGIDVCLDGQFHLAAGLRCGQQLNPQVERHGRLHGLELDGLGLFALNDLQLDPRAGGLLPFQYC